MANTGPINRGTESAAVTGTGTSADADTRRLQDELAELRRELTRVSSLVGDIATNRYEAAKERAAGYAEEAVRQGAVLRDEAYARAGALEAEAERTIRERPLAAVAIAAGVGYIIGLISRSR
ncbi:glycine zipper domain-containing protein [Chthonobacter rhizosphaerae]|uniref:glycine zipper domain-containing protein n=1 Tax=Chthonobacter rhizosphaerae TaxID=2735553 RepID=UPI0015EEF22E|nr:DUF883 family protein [Chthonobacter rhizosphaerae]